MSMLVLLLVPPPAAPVILTPVADPPCPKQSAVLVILNSVASSGVHSGQHGGPGAVGTSPVCGGVWSGQREALPLGQRSSAGHPGCPLPAGGEIHHTLQGVCVCETSAPRVSLTCDHRVCV